MESIIRAMENNEWLIFCIDCGRYAAIKDKVFHKYDVPEDYRTKNVTGGLCLDCLTEWKRNKVVAMYCR
jgi:hypothetical protein